MVVVASQAPADLSPAYQQSLLFFDMKRTFSKREKQALYIVADGKCEICGCELEPGWHADHIQPFSKGGETDVVNGQALCAKCNMQKGNRGMKDRKWQTRFWDEIRRFEGTNYLLVACPASGKTYAAAKYAADNMGSRYDYVLVIVPGLNVKTHWAQTAQKVGIDLDSGFANGGPFRKDMHGVITTYASLASAPQLYQKLLSRGRWLLIADECHHTGTHEDSSWGEALQQVGDVAMFRLLLSGTPFRTDRRSIPFVQYEEDVAILDFELEYHQALYEKIVRPVFFRYYDGEMAWEEIERGRVDVSFDDDLKDEEANTRLSVALRVLKQPSLAGEMIKNAHQELIELRQDNPRAAAMVLCIDQEHAQKVSDMMAQWIGIRPVLVISSDSEAQDKIERFRHSSDPWLVSVQMVSEGTDIPRLQIGVYLTTTKTELFWRQAIGRFIRAECGGDAVLHLPGDPRLKLLAEHYTKRVEAYLRDEELIDIEERNTEERTMDESSFITYLESMGELAGTIYADENFRTAFLERIKNDVAFRDVIQYLPVEKIAAFVQKEIRIASQQIPHKIEEPRQEKTRTERIHELRKTNANYVGRIARKHDIEHADVNRMLNRKVGIRGVNESEATEEKLNLRLRMAKELFETGRLS